MIIIKFNDNISVFYGKCPSREGFMADGYVDGHNLICGLYGWDYRVGSGVYDYNNKEVLHKFSTRIEGDDLFGHALEMDAYYKNSITL